MPPTPRLHKHNAILLRKKVNWNDSEIREKSFPLVGRACRDKSISI